MLVISHLLDNGSLTTLDNYIGGHYSCTPVQSSSTLGSK